MKNLRLYHVGLTSWVCLSYMMFVALDGNVVVRMTQEDGIVEWIGALGFLVASAIFIFLFFRVDSAQDLLFVRPKKNIFFLALGVLFFLGFGEEISWGQRLFEIETPHFMSQINTKNEINIHNTIFFHEVPRGPRELGEINIISVSRLFSIFWFFYCVILPIVGRVKLLGYFFAEKIKLPVISLWIGSVFMINYAISKVFEASYAEFAIGIIEVKEANFAILFVFVGMYFWLCARSKTSPNINLTEISRMTTRGDR